MINVFEPDPNSGVPSLRTDYGYDGLNNLTSVVQHGIATESARNRTFTYDSLSRLLTAANPETGTICYGVWSGANCIHGYDANGNVTEKTDARSIVTKYQYDVLNRLTSKAYFAGNPLVATGDPVVCFQYDAKATGATDLYPKGRLTMEWTAPSCPVPGQSVTAIPSSAFSSTAVWQHDPTGRVLWEYQCPLGSACSSSYQFKYLYDLAGHTTSFNNGLAAGSDPIQWGATYDPAGRTSSVTVSQQPWTFDAYHPPILLQSDPSYTLAAMGTPYDAFGLLVAEQAGLTTSTGAAGLEIKAAYDVRGRITSEAAGSQTAPHTIATGSFGVIAVNGSEQPPTVSLPTTTTATATVSIAGTERSVVIQYPCGPSTCSTTVYDGGPVTLNVGSSTVSTGYSQASTPAMIASSLAGAVNNLSTMPVTATSSGATVFLTAKTSGTAGNSITLSATAATGDPGQFSGSSFSANVSGGTLTGGSSTPGYQVYDSGNVVVQINGVNATPVSWGQNSTSSSLTSAIVAVVNAADGSFVHAAIDDASGSVSLSSTTLGAATNYPVVLNVTPANPALFPAQSFEFDSSSTAGGAGVITSYAPIYSYTIPLDGYAPNGNILAHSDRIMGDWAFQYDSLNRLTAAAPAQNVPSAYQDKMGCWVYDSFGNRLLSSLSPNDCTGLSPATVTYNAKNQVTWASTASGGFVYDGGVANHDAGNVTQDGTTVAGTNHYAYDAEGRLCAVENQPTTGGVTYTQYVYNADGIRVARGTRSTLACPAPSTANGFTPTAEYLVDEGGDQVTELNGAGAWQHSNVWAGSHLDATYDALGLHFHIADPLGTRRVQSDALGHVEENCQSLPFGDMLSCIIPTGAPSTADDATEHHFTGKERDTESGLDYMDARYYGSSMGRFMSPDPVFATVNRLADPQQWNMYSYGRNNPLSNSDPTGLDFNLTCSQNNGSTCVGGLQGQIVNGSFQATDVDMNDPKNASAGYSDQFGNNYTGTFDQNNGVSFTNTATNATSSNSQFIDGSDQTNVNGSGAFSGIQGQFNSNCGGSCEAKGSLYDLPGHTGAVSALEKMIGASFEDNLNFFGGHGKSISFRFGDDQLTHIVNHLAGPDAGKQEVHFEGHAPGRDLTNFVLHQVDAIRDSANHQSAQEPRLP